MDHSQHMQHLPVAWTVVGAFLTGLLGAFAHCTLMCGGFVLAFGVRDGRRDRLRLSLFQAGRILTYASLALLLAALGEGSRWLAPDAGRKFWSVALGIVMLVMAVRVGWPEGVRISRGIGVFAQRLGAVMRRARAAGTPGLLLAGMAWGLLPCAFSWAAIVGAAAAGPDRAPLIAAAFGLGTALPLQALGELDRGLLARGGVALRRALAILLAVWAVWTILRGLR